MSKGLSIRAVFIFPIGFYVKLIPAVAAILDFGSAPNEQSFMRSTQGTFLPSLV